MRAGVSMLDPYMHGYIGVQIAKPLSLTFRQSAETSNFTEDADHLYPGADLKLRLVKETATRPAIAIGMQSAFGHKKMAGEYLALSKRYNNFDFTAGLGWGRFGTAGHLDNPFKIFGDHFEDDRDYNSELPNTPDDWFTGDKIGFFAGLEYFLPYEGMSLKLDYGADRYSAEKASFGYEAGAPWGIGLSYTHDKWLSAQIGAQGTDKVMGRISLQASPEQWPLTGQEIEPPRNIETDDYAQQPAVQAIIDSAAQENITLKNIIMDEHSIHVVQEISLDQNTPRQIGRAARHIKAYTNDKIEHIEITPRHMNLFGKTIKITRNNVDKFVDKSLISPQEVWENTEFVVSDTKNTEADIFIHSRGINVDKIFRLALENQLSLSEEHRGALYRTSAFVEAQGSPFLGFIVGGALRLNIKDNLDDVNLAFLSPFLQSSGSFANKRISLENAYLGYAHSFTPSVHGLVLSGYFEERYAGMGGEILYRPPSSRFAVGAEAWLLAPREANTTLNASLIEDSRIFTGYLNGWYDLPYHDITLNAKAGKYNEGDVGISLGLQRLFDNGATLNGSIALSRETDLDPFGGTTHAFHSINLTLPIGSLPIIPSGSEIRTRIEPIDRITAQTIHPPIRLFDLTENFTLDHLARHWNTIMD